MLHLSYSTLFAVTANLLDPAVLQFVIVIYMVFLVFPLVVNVTVKIVMKNGNHYYNCVTQTSNEDVDDNSAEE